MKLFGLNINVRKASKKEIQEVTSTSYGSGIFLHSRNDAMLLSTVYRCVDVISDSVAQLPLETYKLDAEGFKSPYIDHPAYYLMNDEPNENMTRFTFFKTMVASVLLKGNAYAYIERNPKGDAIQLVYLPVHQVDIMWVADSFGIKRKRYKVIGFSQLIEPSDMIHVLNFSYDGIIGVSTLTHARQTLGIATSSEAKASGFLQGGGGISGVLTIEGTRLTKEQKEQNYKEWHDRIVDSPGGIVILEQNQKFQPITINPKDAQLLESRQFNVVDICRFFSVSPVKAFDLSKSSYATVEATQLGFLTDTCAPMLVKIEQEFQRKLFRPSERGFVKIEFNTSGFLRADKAAQANYFQTMFNVGAMTPNEIRRENNLPKVEHGDKAFLQVNIQTIDSAVTNPKMSDNSVVNNKKQDGK